MNLDWLEDFLSLAEEQNFSRAAERRHVTQPAFGRRIRALEQWVGADLFVRTKTGTVLSPPGEQFHLYIQASVRDIYRARAEALDVARRADATLTIAATHALSFTFFPEWIREHAPHEPCNLMSDSMLACEQMMLRGSASFLLAHSHPLLKTALSPRDFQSIKVGEDVLVPVCRPDAEGYPLWQFESAEAPAGIPYLAYSSESGLGRILEADWASRRQRLPLTTVVQSRLAAALLTMAADGRGVAWVPRSLAASALAAGQIVHVASEPYWTRIDITLMRPRTRLASASERLWKTVTQPAPCPREP